MSKYQFWLSCDPGSTNFAVTVLRYNVRTGGVKLLYCAKLENPIKNLTATPVHNKKRRGKADLVRDEPSFDVGFLLYQHEILWLFDNFPITHVAAERFQARGINQSDQGEVISLMLGVLYSIASARKAKFFTTIAGVWKGFMHRQGMDLLSVYENGKLLKVEPHPIDSTLIGLWHANRERKWPIVKMLPRLHQLLQASKEQ